MKKPSESHLTIHPEYGFFQVSPTPSKEEITAFYAEEFYSGDYKNFNDSSLEVQVNDREWYEGCWENMAIHISEILDRPLADLDMLDIGCGYAQALLFFKDKGLNCYGFDPAPEAIDYGISKGLNLKHAGMDNMDVFEGKKFDVVMLINVLEHLGDPVQVIREIQQKVLVPGGMIIIDVPNEFNKFQTAGRDTHNLDNWWIAPPAHLNYFSPETLGNLLKGCNFEPVLAEASFPLEMFLLFGENYVTDGKLGKKCHNKRVAFETNLRKLGHEETLRGFYQSLAKLNLGRQVTMYARSK